MIQSLRACLEALEFFEIPWILLLSERIQGIFHNIQCSQTILEILSYTLSYTLKDTLLLIFSLIFTTHPLYAPFQSPSNTLCTPLTHPLPPPG